VEYPSAEARRMRKFRIGIGRSVHARRWPLDGFFTRQLAASGAAYLSVFVDRSDGVWTATSKGVACLRADGRWSVFDVKNSGSGENLVTDIAQDRSGGFWFATSYGVSRLRERFSRAGGGRVCPAHQ
jgi:ligand-binding sensor domain-containing protein